MSRRRKQNTNIQKLIQKLFREFWKLAASFTNSLLDWLLRGLLVTGTRQHRQRAKAGFVLPTVTMLLVVVALVIGSILLRTGSRTNQVISERNQQIIYNAATPAVDRAKAKLEFLFKQDDRLPQGTPSEARLMSMLLNDGQNSVDRLPENPYNLRDETQLDLDGGGLDPAWSFRMDTNGDGQPDTTVAYSIIFKTRHPLVDDENNPNPPRPAVDRTKRDKDKAEKLVIRNGPIIAEDAIDPACARLNLQPEQGWDLAGTATLLKTFQVSAVVVSNPPGSSGNRTIVTQEYQQDRELARGNRWGAWFRDDLHVYPGTTFNWNGAMHTEGSLMVGGSNTVTGFLISSPKSCVYDPKTNSEVTIRRITSDTQSNTQRLPEFFGQMVNGDLADDTTGTAGSKFHIQAASPDFNGNNVEINNGKDSVSRGTPSEIALDPVKLFTEDISQSRDPGDRSNRAKSIPEWSRADNPKISNDRIKAISDSKPPYVDDTYRADNRLGPKPRYRIGEGIPDVTLNDSSRKSGTKIDSAGLTGDQVTRLTTNTVLLTDTQYKKLGLDGYWERRAKLEGLRIIVGQRLELGNPFGWGELRDTNGNGKFGEFTVSGERVPDPLYPIYRAPGLTPPISHQQQQRRTLRDNLAAIQATVVYQNTVSNGDTPLACMATTSHPGTQNTIENSTNFSLASAYYGGSYPGQPYQLFSDFFTGRGTNGWEYNAPPPGSFTGGALRNAIQNLANFAGDYENSSRSGAFPPTQEDGRIHPDPYLTMWGNFSNLKRALSPDGNNSIADQSYIHTAGCALGMLAYNVNYFNAYNYTGDGRIAALRTGLSDLFDANPSNGRVVLDTNGNITELRNYNNTQIIIPPGSPPVPITPDLLISALDPATTQPVARLFAMKEQIFRDRRMGFVPSTASTVSLDLDGQPTTTNDNVPSSSLSSSCSDTALNTSTTDPLRLLCPGQTKFPSLRYIFPDNTVSPPSANRTTGNGDVDTGEPYIQETRSIPQFNVGGGFVQISDGDIGAIANDFRPKNPGSWTLPTGNSASVSAGDPNIDNAFRVFDQNNNPLFVPLLDKGIFDGREMMSVRVLDIDLQRLRNASINSDRWLPNSGIIYAFREDAVREDAIARPSAGDYTDPNSPIRTNATNPNDPKDPQIKSNGISPKPVDFYPDPDRRPYGFRLRNGAELSRPDIPDKYTQRGLTFISDNSVFIQGDFNRHSQQEFSETLGDNFDANQFYGRSSLNTNFATRDNDTWRPSEILADAITLLSKDFRDGNIASGLSGIQDLSSGGSNQHSYRGQNPIDSRTRNWVRENGLVAQGTEPSTTHPGVNIPIKISRTGQPLVCSAPPAGTTPCLNPTPYPDPDIDVDFANQSRRDKLNKAAPTQINATLVSGIVPARRQQGNGGFQNFPRFLEHWGGVRMGISGSFIQLNFSTAATAPFEQEAWEPNQTPNSNDQFRWYYEPPNRAWGYDVGLQYAPAGPVSRRLVPVGAPRSEFYEEPKANDPYVCMLRKAIAGREAFNEPSSIVQQECE